MICMYMYVIIQYIILAGIVTVLDSKHCMKVSPCVWLERYYNEHDVSSYM